MLCLLKHVLHRLAAGLKLKCDRNVCHLTKTVSRLAIFVVFFLCLKLVNWAVSTFLLYSLLLIYPQHERKHETEGIKNVIKLTCNRLWVRVYFTWQYERKRRIIYIEMLLTFYAVCLCLRMIEVALYPLNSSGKCSALASTVSPGDWNCRNIKQKLYSLFNKHFNVLLWNGCTYILCSIRQVLAHNCTVGWVVRDVSRIRTLLPKCGQLQPCTSWEEIWVLFLVWWDCSSSDGISHEMLDAEGWDSVTSTT
jgi:hypothetical protein